MPDQPSKLVTPFNFDTPGKHCDFVRMPHSVHRSAYGWLPLPIVCINRGDGPTVLLMSGTHGDEYEGQVTLTRLAQILQPADIAGRLIIFPMANYPAAKAGLRTSPIDDLNLNNVFPGDPNGSATMMIAHYIETVLMEMSDYGLDLHSGGSSLHYLPSAVAGVDENDKRTRRIQDLMQVFGAPYSFIFPGVQTRSGSFASALRRNVLFFGTEMGGSGTVTPNCLEICFDGVTRFLYEIGLLKNSIALPAARPSRMLHAPTFDHFTYTLDVGLFEPIVDLGNEVRKGDIAARIHFPELPWKKPVEVFFDADGLVACKRVPGRVERGDCLFHLGADLTH